MTRAEQQEALTQGVAAVGAATPREASWQLVMILIDIDNPGDYMTANAGTERTLTVIDILEGALRGEREEPTELSPTVTIPARRAK